MYFLLPTIDEITGDTPRKPANQQGIQDGTGWDGDNKHCPVTTGSCGSSLRSLLLLVSFCGGVEACYYYYYYFFIDCGGVFCPVTVDSSGVSGGST